MVRRTSTIAFMLFIGSGPWLPLPAAEDAGARIFREKCASCHGSEGQGTKRYKKRLEGDHSVAQLADLIKETMPEDDPGTLSAADARAVAAYVHDAFYSRVARERNRPARVELARLTVRQYRQAVADLINSFRPPLPVLEPGTPTAGLRAEYFSGRRINPRSRVLERIDPKIHFDFGTATPVPEKTEPHEFSIRWSGGVYAPETGVYEFMVRTEHAARLWVNDVNRPLIDAWVKSGKDTEYRGSLYLAGGRSYPLRLEFSKAKQGVDDSKKQKEKPVSQPASIALLWKRPLGELEPVSSRNLAPRLLTESFICATPFPPDDRSYGWERGNNVSREWDQATTEAAIEVAAYVAAHMDELAGIRAPERRGFGESGNPASISLDNPAQGQAATDRPAKLRTFCTTFAERAFRQPLPPELSKLLIDKQFAENKAPEEAVKRIVLLTLKSPRFLFREVGQGPESYDVAARLAFGLWDSIPDAELLSLAARGGLRTRADVVRQADRMENDPRARAKLHEFLLRWVKADHGLDVAKDAERFPGFDAAVIADLRTSLELFLDEVAFSADADFRRFFLTEHVYLNGRLARFYGVELPADADFQKVLLDGGRRAGVLTHPYLMTSFAHSQESSPIHRGVFLARGVLGQSLRPPPEAVAPLAPSLHPHLTTRERVALQTQAATCMSCHSIINPLGFTLEHFDAVGRYRDRDNQKPVDASGSYRTRSGQVVTLKNARELGAFLAASEEAQEAFVEQLFHHLVQQPVRAYGPEVLDQLRQGFVQNGFNIRRLAVEIMARAALKPRETNTSAAAVGADQTLSR